MMIYRRHRNVARRDSRPDALAVLLYVAQIVLEIVRRMPMDLDGWLIVLACAALAGEIYWHRATIAADKRRFEAWVESWRERLFRGRGRD
jgi:hypothetical protein